MGDTKNIKLGTCNVTFDGVDLGLTIGGVELEVTTSTHETKVDQYGETIVEQIITGRTVKVTVPLGETTLENMVKIMPGATLTTQAGPPIKKKVIMKTGAGISLLAIAKPLILHPTVLVGTDKSEDVLIPLAATSGAIKFAYKHDQERVFNIEFNAYPDPITGNMVTFGDPTVP